MDEKQGILLLWHNTLVVIIRLIIHDIVHHVILFHTTVNSTSIFLVLIQGLVERFVSDDVQLQISSLYATQVFCYDKQFPKGNIIDHLV